MLNNYYWIWQNAIPKEICEYVIQSTDWGNAEDGTVYAKESNNQVVDGKIRKTNVVWVSQMTIMGCIANQYIKAANQSANWNFIVDSLEEIQLGQYEVGGHYDWHKDTFAPVENKQRKLSISMLLNDDFEGGEFEFKDLGNTQQPKMEQGSIIVFPSYLEHRVNPITKGTRFSSVTWATGPSFV